MHYSCFYSLPCFHLQHNDISSFSVFPSWGFAILIVCGDVGEVVIRLCCHYSGGPCAVVDGDHCVREKHFFCRGEKAKEAWFDVMLCPFGCHWNVKETVIRIVGVASLFCLRSPEFLSTRRLVGERPWGISSETQTTKPRQHLVFCARQGDMESGRMYISRL